MYRFTTWTEHNCFTIRVMKMLIGTYGQLLSTYFGKHTLAWHAVTTQVVANSAGAASGVLRCGEAELWASSVVNLALVSSWMLSTISKRQEISVCVFLCLYLCVCVLWACLPFWPSLSYTFIWTTPPVLFLRVTGFRPSLLVTVPSCADSSSTHHSLPPVTHQCHLLIWI